MAVTRNGVATSRVRAALEFCRSFSAVSTLTCALPTETTERRESDLVAAPAATRALADLSCSCARSSAACAAARFSRAARTLKYCVETSSATWYLVRRSLASAEATFALAALRLYIRLPASKRVRFALRPRL